MAKYKVYIKGKLDGEMSFTDAEMAHLKKSGYGKKRGVTFRKASKK